MIKFLLNTLPRPLIQRVAGWAVPIMGWLYLGKGKRCPVCGCERRRFLPYGYVEQREDALCPNCLALERHRLLWLWLLNESDLGRGAMALPRLLHIAPEVSLMRRLRRMYEACPERYVTADLESPLADLHFDIHTIPLADGEVDVVICNHIMEHLEDDRRAMRELYRILRPGGWGVLLSPVDESRETTFEDDTITDEKQRTLLFGQYDHRRVYGRDYASRLAEAGFEVDVVDYFNHLTPQQRTLYGLKDEKLYIVYKPTTE